MRTRLAVLVVTAAAAAPLAIAVPAAHAACTTATKTVYGSIMGSDRRSVDALIGLDVLDRNGNHLGATQGTSAFGCTGQRGYGLTIRVNRDLPATGSTTTGTKSWKAVIPANATHMWIEVYPQAAGYGGTNESRYGHTMRRKIPVPYGQTVNLRLPLVCAQGGSTGKIHGYTTRGGVRTRADRVAAWSLAPDNNTPSPILGFNVGFTQDNGYFAIPNLPTGQYYTVRVTMRGVTKTYNNVRFNACGAVPMGPAF